MTLKKDPSIIRSHVSGPQHHSWRGGRQQSGNGAIMAVVHGHPHADVRGRVYEHVLVAERALGKPLPPSAVVHHRNEDRTDNRAENLVICEDQAYHMTLHRRLRAYRACGQAGWFQCQYCRAWEPAGSLVVSFRGSDGVQARHRQCHATAERLRRTRVTE